MNDGNYVVFSGGETLLPRFAAAPRRTVSRPQPQSRRPRPRAREACPCRYRPRLRKPQTPCHQAFVKLGAQGCRALIDGAFHRAAAVPVSVVDTVGAGVAFVAGYISEWLSGCAPDQRLATATRAGAFACETAGGLGGYAVRHELGWLEAREPVQR